MSLLPDVIWAARTLRRAPLFTVAAVASLALGIAASTTVFSLVDAAVLRQPPFRGAERLTILNMTQRTPAQGELRVRWSWPRFQLLSRTARSFEGVASSSNNVVTLTGAGDPEPIAVEVVSSRYLSVMGASLILGAADSSEPRGFSPGGVVLSHALWQQRFAGSQDVVGRAIELNGVPLTVTGVAEDGFAGVSGLARAWIPATMAPLMTYSEYLTTNQNFITVVGRLRPGVSMEAAQAEMHVLGPRIHAEHPLELETPQDQISAAVMSLRDARTDVVTRRALGLLAGGVGLLLLIACANVASLLLGRAAGRRREIAMRLALGASRLRLVRQLLVESGALAAIAGVLGLIAAAWAIRFVRIPPTLARVRNFYGAVGEFAVPSPDWRVFVFAVALTAATVLVFGLLPAFRATRTDLFVDLRGGATSASGRRGRLGLREMAVAVQVALAVVLTVGCGLLIASYSRLRETPLGFDSSRLLTFMIRPSEVAYPTAAAPALIDRVLAEIGRVPGVESATVDGCVPLSMQCAIGTLQIVGRQWPSDADAPMVRRHYVARDHFATLGIPVLRGRAIADTDRRGQPRVVVVNEAAVQKFWPNEDPIGRRIWFVDAPEFDGPDSSAEVVGVVGNTAYRPLDEEPVQPDFFTSYAQFTYATRMVIVRTRGEPLALTSAIARAVRNADPALALFDVQTMASRATVSWSKRTFQTSLFVAIGLIALVLAVTGVYAVASHFVTSRTREIGVRMALGADRVQIARTSIGQTVRVGLIGGVAGGLVALGMSRALRATLYETSPWDPGVYAAAAAVLIVALVAASYVPVRRAVRVNPIEVLRAE
jgi:putative ABC transport system permease protein